jgi:acyl carrier protein
MTAINFVKKDIFNLISELLDDNSQQVTEDMPLIGGDSVLNSMKLVELCLLLEDKALESGFEFDWTSDVAMSRSRSMFRTAGSLAEEFISQMKRQK